MDDSPVDVGEVTALLKRLQTSAADDALENLLDVVYDELRCLARRGLARERPDHTLSATDLVHEAYLKLVKQEAVTWSDRSHFFAVAATAMRRVLIDHARRRRSKKRGGDVALVTLGTHDAAETRQPEEILRLDDALEALAEVAPRQAKVVEYRYFVGLTDAEIAELLGIGVATVGRDWRSARAWLHRELGDGW